VYYKNQSPKEKWIGNSTKESDLCLTKSQSLYNRVKSIENQGYEPPRMKQEMRMENEHKRKKKGPNSFSHKSFIPSFGFALLTQIIQKSSEFDTQFHEQYQIILLTLTIALKYLKEHLLIFFNQIRNIETLNYMILDSKKNRYIRFSHQTIVCDEKLNITILFVHPCYFSRL